MRHDSSLLLSLSFFFFSIITRDGHDDYYFFIITSRAQIHFPYACHTSFIIVYSYRATLRCMTVLSNFICDMFIVEFVIASIDRFVVCQVTKSHLKTVLPKIVVGHSSKLSILNSSNVKTCIYESHF